MSRQLKSSVTQKLLRQGLLWIEKGISSHEWCERDQLRLKSAANTIRKIADELTVPSEAGTRENATVA